MNEEKFILNASRLNLADENIEELKDLSGKDLDWDLLSKKASFQGVTTFIYYSLKINDLTRFLPLDILNKFQNDHFITALRNVKFIKKIEEITNFIEDKIVLLKGGYLISDFYPNVGIRSMSDIDILVEKEKAISVWNLIKSNGFVRQGPHRWSATKSTVHDSVVPFHHLDLLHSNDCDIEVHSNLFEFHDFFDETEMAFKKAVPINPKNTLYRLSDEFFLIHLCSHFYLHNYLHNQKGKNLRMLCDINEFILKRGHDIDWNEIENVCSDPELKNRTSTTLTYAYYFLQTPIPHNFILKNLINKYLDGLDSINNKEMLNIQQQQSNLSRFFFRLKRLDKPFNVLIFVFRTFIPVKEWINFKYNTGNNKPLIMSYFRYWIYLVNRYVFKIKVD